MPAIVLGVVLAVAVVGSGAFLFARAAVKHVLGPQGDLHAAMVPASVDGYVAVANDPSGQQKLNLFAMAHKFPKTATNAEIDRQVETMVDDALSGSGLTYKKDVKPWLGRQVSVAFTINSTSPDKSDYAVLLASRDDAAARAAIATLKAKRKSDSSFAHLQADLVDGSVVLASSSKLMQAIVATDAGKQARLSDSAGFKAAMARVQADRLVGGYVNAHALAAKLKDSLTSSTSPLPFGSSAQALKSLDAYTGGAFSLAARPDGIESDLWVGIDKTKLPADAASALATASQPNALVRLIPSQAFVAYAGTGVKQAVKQLQDAGSTAPSGALGPDSVPGLNAQLSHLGDDAALEVDKVTGDKYVGGALLLQTDDAAGMKTLLEQLLELGQVFGSSTNPPKLPSAPRKESYHGTTVEYLVIPVAGDSIGVKPAFAISNGVVVIGSTPAHVEQILAQQASTGGGITADPLFDAAVPSGDNGNFFYVDIQRGAGVLRTSLSAADRASYDANVAPDLAPLKAFSITAKSSQDGFIERLVLLIQ